MSLGAEQDSNNATYAGSNMRTHLRRGASLQRMHDTKTEDPIYMRPSRMPTLTLRRKLASTMATDSEEIVLFLADIVRVRDILRLLDSEANVG